MADRVQATASFKFKGWDVSMSTIFNKDCVEVLTWKVGEEDRAFATVELAIVFITGKE